jgi:hypothetical protein
MKSFIVVMLMVASNSYSEYQAEKKLRKWYKAFDPTLPLFLSTDFYASFLPFSFPEDERYFDTPCPLKEQGKNHPLEDEEPEDGDFEYLIEREEEEEEEKKEEDELV